MYNIQFPFSDNHQLSWFIWMAFKINRSNLWQFWIIIERFRLHPSIKYIKRNYKITSKLSLKPVPEEFVRDILNYLSSNKAAVREIPLKILKEFDFYLQTLTNCINEAIKNNKFQDSFKLSNIEKRSNWQNKL